MQINNLRNYKAVQEILLAKTQKQIFESYFLPETRKARSLGTGKGFIQYLVPTLFYYTCQEELSNV